MSSFVQFYFHIICSLDTTLVSASDIRQIGDANAIQVSCATGSWNTGGDPCSWQSCGENKSILHLKKKSSYFQSASDKGEAEPPYHWESSLLGRRTPHGEVGLASRAGQEGQCFLPGSKKSEKILAVNAIPRKEWAKHIKIGSVALNHSGRTKSLPSGNGRGCWKRGDEKVFTL